MFNRISSRDRRGASSSSLKAFVELRRRLLNAELDTATLVGRTADVGAIKAELRCLDAEPSGALMVRTTPGRLRAVSSMADFDSQARAVHVRLAELEAEVKQWRAAQNARRKR